MKKIVFICGGLQIVIMYKFCHEFSLERKIKNSRPRFVIGNVWDKNIIV